MFNVRPDTPWIYLNPDLVDDDPPGLRLAPDGLAMGTGPSSFGFGQTAYGPGTAGVPAAGTASGAFYLPSQAPIDAPYNPFPFATVTRHPFQGPFDQLARIYAGVGSLRQQAAGFGSAPVDSGARSQGSPVLPELANPWLTPPTRVSDSRFMPLSYGNPSVQGPVDPFAGDGRPFSSATTTLAPPNPLPFESDTRPPMAAAAATAPWPSSAKEGEVLSDAVSDDSLWDGQQYVQYRPPVAIGGVKGGLDEEGRSVLLPDGDQRDPLEKIRQRGYPRPPDDPANGSAMVKELREREQYGQHHAGYHRYEFTDHLCDRSDPSCTTEAAYEALLRYAVPGGPTPGMPVSHGMESPVSLMGVPGGRVRTLVDSDSKSIINHTLPDHQFYNGFVQRQIVEKNGKLYLRTFGEGNNSNPEKSPRRASGLRFALPPRSASNDPA